MIVKKIVLALMMGVVLSGCSWNSKPKDPPNLVDKDKKIYRVVGIHSWSNSLDLMDTDTGYIHKGVHLKWCAPFDQIKIDNYVEIQQNTYEAPDGSYYKKLYNVRDSVCGTSIRSYLY